MNDDFKELCELAEKCGYELALCDVMRLLTTMVNADNVEALKAVMDRLSELKPS